MATAPSTPRTTEPTPAIRGPLDQLKGLIRAYVTLEGLGIVLIGLLAWFWVSLALDYGVFSLLAIDWVQVSGSQSVRTAALVLLGLILAVILVVKIAVRLLRDFRPDSLALLLEKRYPEVLGDRLITAVELCDLNKAAEYGYSTAMIRQTTEEAAERVKQIQASAVFNWKRLRHIGVMIGLLSLGGLVLVFAINAAAHHTPSQPADAEAGWVERHATGLGNWLHGHSVRPGDLPRQFSDIAVIWFERNVLLMNTIWPRQAFLELVDFPADGVVKLNREAASYRLRVRAYKWIIADPKTPEGWRPLRLKDLKVPLVGGLAPTRTAVYVQREAVRGLGSSWLSMPLAATTAQALSDAYLHELLDPETSVDRLEAALDGAIAVPTDDPSGVREAQLRDLLREVLDGDQFSALEMALAELHQKAADPKMSRTLRKLTVPETVRTVYWGLRTSNEMPLARGSDNEYTASLSDLKESVYLYVGGLDYYTATKRIELVPPPQLARLTRSELRPAYLYHRPPLDVPDKDVKAVFAKLYQRVEGEGVRIDGPLSEVGVVSGTILTLHGMTDKPLRSLRLTPKSLSTTQPGSTAIATAEPMELPITADGYGFAIEFGKIDTSRLVELEITDTDGITATRLIKVTPAPDPEPKVEVVVVGIRKTPRGYMVTPDAEIPFEGVVSDENGLSEIRYEFNYSVQESQAVMGARAGVAATIMQCLPAGNPAGMWIVPIYAFDDKVTRIVRGETAAGSGDKTLPLRTFQERLAEVRQNDLVRAKIDAILNVWEQPKDPRQPDGDKEIPALEQQKRLIRKFDIRPGRADQGGEKFDLREVKDARGEPALKNRDAGKVQPTYKLSLRVVAVDNNVLSGPSLGRSKETFQFVVVSEAELLAEIARDSDALAQKTREAVEQLRGARLALGKALQIASELQLAKPEDKDQLTTQAVQAKVVQETITKCRELTQDVHFKFTAIIEEMRLNRVTPQIITRKEEPIVQPLADVLAKTYPDAEEKQGELVREMESGRKPTVELGNAAAASLNELLSRMESILAAMDEESNLSRLQQSVSRIAQAVRDNEEILRKLFFKLQTEQLWRIASIDLQPIAPLTLGKNQRAKLMLTIEGEDVPESYLVRLVPPADSDFKIETLELAVQPKATQAIFEFAAGTKPGTYLFKVTKLRVDGQPIRGKDTEVQITVK